MIESIHIVTCDGCGKELMRKSGAMPTPSEVKEAGGLWCDGWGIRCFECVKREYNTNNLSRVPRQVAEEMFNEKGKEKWCAAHNVGANLYWVKDGKIAEIEPQGWWK